MTQPVSTEMFTPLTVNKDATPPLFRGNPAPADPHSYFLRVTKCQSPFLPSEP
ncbi:hypothetical protein OG258_49275 [Streptomyces mirabilis]|uniref:hypothetical protein n=1 Tax=Streptomyces mirabilis TaxID=68239 RepID=UPI002E285238|nr:hypothetical protein [Streptomyces mirabilis]